MILKTFILYNTTNFCGSTTTSINMPRKYKSKSPVRNRSPPRRNSNKSYNKNSNVKKYQDYSDSDSSDSSNDSRSDSNSDNSNTDYSSSSDSEDNHRKRRTTERRQNKKNLEKNRNSRSLSRSPSPVKEKKSVNNREKRETQRRETQRETREERENKRETREERENKRRFEKKQHYEDEQSSDEQNHTDEDEKHPSKNLDYDDESETQIKPAKRGRPSLNQRSKQRSTFKDEREYEEHTSNLKEEQSEKVMNGPPKYRVVTFNGEELTVRKMYTSNIGPKNAAQKAFNRMCDQLNEKMEISVEKVGDKSGKIMTYLFMKQELDPPIEREIGGKKVVYRHKTVSC